MVGRHHRLVATAVRHRRWRRGADLCGRHLAWSGIGAVLHPHAGGTRPDHRTGLSGQVFHPAFGLYHGRFRVGPGDEFMDRAYRP